MREYGEAKLARCEAAERVLAHAVERDGYMVAGARLLHYWPMVHSGPIPKEALEARWERLLEPAVAAGRVRRVKARAGYCYGPAEGPDLTPPPAERRVRTFGKVALQRCLKAERALRHAVREAGVMVPGRVIERAWRAIDLGEVTPELSRWGRTLEPALVSGRVRCVVVGSVHRFYAPADIDVLPPEYPSDSARLVEGTRRAELQAESAVLCEAVAAAIAADSALELESDLTVGQMLPMLVHAGALKSFHVAARGRTYFATLSGPSWITLDAMAPLDKRRRAIEYFWQATGGRPFSTRAVQRYTERSEKLRMPGDPPWAWTCALQALERHGEIVRIKGAHRWFKLWAPAAEWSCLSEEERSARLADGRPSCEPDFVQPSWDARPEGEHDPGGFSRNEDMRRLVLEAKRHLGWSAGAGEPRDTMLSRPVSLADVRAAAAAHPHFLSHAVDLRLALHEAARKRAGMCESSVVKIGRVGRRTYYDIRRSAESDGYFNFIRALRKARSRWIERAYTDLIAISAADESGSVTLGPIVLSAQLQLMHRILEDRLVGVNSAREAVRLLRHEHEESDTLADSLLERFRMIEIIAAARGIPLTSIPSSPVIHGRGKLARRRRSSLVPIRKNPMQLAGGRPGDGSLVEYSAVMEDLQQLEGVPPIYPRLLSTRLPLVRTRSFTPRRSKRVRGRMPERMFDRPALVCYALLRWGGPSNAWLAGLAMPSLGLLRTPDPFVATLQARALQIAQVASAAALAILDTEFARAALVELLRRYVSEGFQEVTSAAAHAATLGLARLPVAPLALELRDDEHDVLCRVAADHRDDSLRKLATRVLQSWNDRWDRDRLLSQL